jgi:hypothetical protein
MAVIFPAPSGAARSVGVPRIRGRSRVEPRSHLTRQLFRVAAQSISDRVN